MPRNERMHLGTGGGVNPNRIHICERCLSPGFVSSPGWKAKTVGSRKCPGCKGKKGIHLGTV